MHRSLLFPLVLLAAACAQPRYFAPRENTNGTGPGGFPAAVYRLGDGAAHGELRVWSGGTRTVEQDGQEVVELHVGFELENTGNEALGLDTGALQCEDLWIGGVRLAALPPAGCAGAAVAGPGTTARLEARFRPVEARVPRDLDGFSVRFVVRAGDRPVLAQVTPFAPWLRDDVWRDDPFWGPRYRGYGAFGFGLGFGFYGRYHCH